MSWDTEKTHATIRLSIDKKIIIFRLRKHYSQQSSQQRNLSLINNTAASHLKHTLDKLLGVSTTPRVVRALTNIFSLIYSRKTGNFKKKSVASSFNQSPHSLHLVVSICEIIHLKCTAVQTFLSYAHQLVHLT